MNLVHRYFASTYLPLVACLSLGLSSAARADSTSPTTSPGQPTTQVFVEVDPSTFAFHGYSGHVRVSPGVLPRWTFGAGVYGLDLPRLLVDLDSANRGEGWEVRIRLGGAVFVDRFFDPGREGVFLGAELGLQRYRLGNPRLGIDSAGFTTLLLMPRAGYLWRPFRAGFYVMPWVGAGVAAKVSGETAVGAGSYHVPPVPIFATLHVGWQF